MKNWNAPERGTLRQVLLVGCAAAFSLLFGLALLQPAHADVAPPPVPENLQVPAGSRLFLVGHAMGTQDYTCLPSGVGFSWTSPGRPQATLFDDKGEQLITHFLSPDANGTPRPTWQHSRDTSAVWAAAIASSNDPAFVASGAIPWLKLQVADFKAGRTGGDKLTSTTYIQRLNTTGGLAPSVGCASAGDVGQRAFVPYRADYFFYK